MNLRNLDLNLLLIFEAIYSERSITKAAEKLALSQPAVSNALNRLRTHLNDPLFERAGKGITPTQEAKRLAPVVVDALKAIDKSLENSETFDPEESVFDFKIAMSDAVEIPVMHPLIRQTAQKWAGISYTLSPIDADKLHQQIKTKEVHLAIFVTPINDDVIRSSHLFSTDVCLIARADHPQLGHKEEITRDDFYNSDWILIGKSMRRASNFHREAKAMGRSRRIVCEASRMMSLPYAVAKSDLVAAVSRQMAEAFADSLKLKVFDVPFSAPQETWYMIWHSDFADDPAHVWLREALRAAVAEN